MRGGGAAGSEAEDGRACFAAAGHLPRSALTITGWVMPESDGLGPLGPDAGASAQTSPRFVSLGDKQLGPQLSAPACPGTECLGAACEGMAGRRGLAGLATGGGHRRRSGTADSRFQSHAGISHPRSSPHASIRHPSQLPPPTRRAARILRVRFTPPERFNSLHLHTGRRGRAISWNVKGGCAAWGGAITVGMQVCPVEAGMWRRRRRWVKSGSMWCLRSCLGRGGTELVAEASGGS